LAEPSVVVADHFNAAGAETLAEAWYWAALDHGCHTGALEGLLRLIESRADSAMLSSLLDHPRLDRASAQDAQMWLHSCLGAVERLDDAELLQKALSKWLQLDALGPEAPKRLLRLGIEAQRDTWIDHALHALTFRCLSAGDGLTAYLAAGALLARETGGAEERLLHEVLGARRGLVPQASVEMPAVSFDGSESDEITSVAWVTPHPDEAELEELVASAANLFGLDGLRAWQLGTWGPEVAALPGATPRVGFREGLWSQLSGSGRRFLLGRAAAAATDPRLARALAEETGDSELQSHLDEAGLLFCFDLLEALSRVGAHSARGLSLLLAAFSEPLQGRWLATGMGLS
jgi:hypothetical protein